MYANGIIIFIIVLGFLVFIFKTDVLKTLRVVFALGFLVFLGVKVYDLFSIESDLQKYGEIILCTQVQLGGLKIELKNVDSFIESNISNKESELIVSLLKRSKRDLKREMVNFEKEIKYYSKLESHGKEFLTGPARYFPFRFWIFESSYLKRHGK